MNPIQKDNISPVQVLEGLKKRLQHRYTIAAERQNNKSRASGRMKGLEEAMQEIDSMLAERLIVQTKQPELRMSVLESQTDIGDQVTLQVWFTRFGNNHIRSEVYRFENGSVVAYQDCINGDNGPLRMDSTFKLLYHNEPAFWTILHYAGVMDPAKVDTFYTGR